MTTKVYVIFFVKQTSSGKHRVSRDVRASSPEEAVKKLKEKETMHGFYSVYSIPGTEKDE